MQNETESVVKDFVVTTHNEALIEVRTNMSTFCRRITTIEVNGKMSIIPSSQYKSPRSHFKVCYIFSSLSF